jgi:hypothetical protein
LLGLLLGLAAWNVAFIERTPTRTLVFALALVAHAVSSVIYFVYVQTTSADTYLYYYDPTGFYGEGFGFGTRFVIYVVQFLKEVIGGSYIDYFLIFQAIGFWGVALLMRIVEEVYREIGIRQPALSYLIVFLPGIHFWTSAIGKDAPLFLGCSVVVWAAIRLRTRFIAFAAMVALMAMIRPHIALIALIALAIATLVDRRVALLSRIGLLLAVAVGGLLVAGTVQSTLTVDVTSADSLGEFLQRNAEATATVEGGSALVSAPYPVRLLSLLFRPFFFDASGAFGLISSFENVFILFVLIVIFRNFRQSRTLFSQVFFLRFAAVFATILALMLAMVYYNVGLGLRQKMMFMPPLLAFFAALVAVRRARAEQAVLVVPSGEVASGPV